jgi:thioredoxin-related protein
MKHLAVLLALVVGLALLPDHARAEELLPEPEVADTGLHIQKWFKDSFLDIGEDLAEARAAGKGLVLIFEQNGCPYCREMHRVNLRRPDIVEQIRSTFHVVQLDLRGSRETVDTDGQKLAEKELARKWGVAFTPTLLFFARDADPKGKPANQAVSAVMPGYFKPFHFASMFDYVASGKFKEAHFQDFIVERRERLRAEGKNVALWD